MIAPQETVFVLLLSQECHSALARHQNVHLLQVERSVRGGWLWASPALQAILSESSLPQSEGRFLYVQRWCHYPS